MKKFNDIFSIDSSTGGGKRLIKDIINKYRLGNEYKEIKENINNKGGSSSEDEIWYKVENLDMFDLINILDFFPYSVMVYETFSDYAEHYIRYNTTFLYDGAGGHMIFGIRFLPFKIQLNDIIYEFNGNTLDEYLDFINQHFNLEDYEGYVDINVIKSSLVISTKEEIEKYMNDKINQ